MKVLSLTSVPYWIEQGDWNMVWHCLNPKYWDFETWGNVLVGMMVGTFLIWLTKQFIGLIKSERQFRKECREEGLDWREYDLELSWWRCILRALRLKFLIRKKYRNLDE